MRRPGIIFLFAIVAGALLSALVYGNLKTQRAELEAAKRAMELGTIDVLVAKESIPIGARVTSDQVHTVRWPANIQPDGALTDATTVVGRVARTGIERNQPIVQTQLVDEGVGLLPLLIPDGMRGMSVKVDDVTGVSGFITPNSRVDVLVAGTDMASGGGEQKSKLILQNVRVLATGTSVEQKDDKPVEVPTVTLLVNPEDAEKLTLASQQNPVRLALRSYKDQEFVGTPGISTRALYGYRAEAPAPVIIGGKKVRPIPYVVEVFLGSKIYRQEFNRNGSERTSLMPVPDDIPAAEETATTDTPLTIGG